MKTACKICGYHAHDEADCQKLVDDGWQCCRYVGWSHPEVNSTIYSSVSFMEAFRLNELLQQIHCLKRQLHKAAIKDDKYDDL